MRLFSRDTPIKGLFFLAACLLAALGVIALSGIRIETNIVNSLPRGNPVLDDGTHVLLNHPYQNQVFIDLGLDRHDPAKLVEAGRFVETGLRESGLFRTVGMEAFGHIFPGLVRHVTDNLPALLTAAELQNHVAPLLEEGVLEERVTENLSGLFTMQGTGRSGAALKDPLGLGGTVLGKLEHLMPAQDIRFYQGRLLSMDERHMLIIANPETTATGTDLARRMDAAVARVTQSLEAEYRGSGLGFTLTPVGAYRAALDNESRARQDTINALVLVTLGIAFLLVLAFPRPHIGLLAFLPAIFGTICALAVFAVWHGSVSVMTIGFGGAIISITVDHGIAYLLFLDRPFETRGKNVSREVRAVAFLAAMTTVGAFSLLSFSGFPILAEIGQFAALGIAFSFFFVHSAFPLLFPSLKPARRTAIRPLQKVVDKLAETGGTRKATAALLLFVFLAFFAYPEFDVDIASMNTVSKETIAAENRVSEVWGDRLFDKVYLMAQAPDTRTLQRRSDALADRLGREVENRALAGAFTPSVIFPGEARCEANLTAWRQFWGAHDKNRLRKRIHEAAGGLGLPAGLFSNVYDSGSTVCGSGLPIDPGFHDMLGIHHVPGENPWLLFTALTPGENYNPEGFLRGGADHADKWLYLLDPGHYSLTISAFLSETFTRMLFFICLSVTVLLVMFFMDPVLSVVALVPLGFSMVCTLGVLGLFGIPLGIPALMLSVVVIGMGLDYSLYFVRGYQRYQVSTHPYQAHIRMTIFLAGISTLVGFGALASGEHNFMKSLGQVLVLGIAFVLVGTFFILPPILGRLFRPVVFSSRITEPGSARHVKRVRRLYRHMEAYPRIFARFKILSDPMFAELPGLVGKPFVVTDIGCGYGVTSAWLIAMDPGIRIQAMDPDPERVRIAKRVVGGRGEVVQGGAPELPGLTGGADLVLMLDMVHYLSDDQFAETLRNLRGKIAPDARVIIRVTIPSENRVPIFRRVELFRLRLNRAPSWFRPAGRIRAILSENGFTLLDDHPSGKDREERWFIAQPDR